MSAPFNAQAFLADLLAADMTVGATPSRPLTALLYKGGPGTPRHHRAAAMTRRFDALSTGDRADLATYILNMGVSQ